MPRNSIVSVGKQGVCGSKNARRIFTLEFDFTAEDLVLLSEGKELIYSSESPHFLLKTSDYTMLGSIGTNRITVEFSGCRIKKFLRSIKEEFEKMFND